MKRYKINGFKYQIRNKYHSTLGLPKVGDFVASFSFLPTYLPDVISTFCQYIISFSAALALLNAVPSYGLDGQWILSAVVEISGQWFGLKHRHKEEIKFFVLAFGTFILAVNIVIAFSNAFQTF